MYTYSKETGRKTMYTMAITRKHAEALLNKAADGARANKAYYESVEGHHVFPVYNAIHGYAMNVETIFGKCTRYYMNGVAYSKAKLVDLLTTTYEVKSDPYAVS